MVAVGHNTTRRRRKDAFDRPYYFSTLGPFQRSPNLTTHHPYASHYCYYYYYYYHQPGHELMMHSSLLGCWGHLTEEVVVVNCCSVREVNTALLRGLDLSPLPPRSLPRTPPNPLPPPSLAKGWGDLVASGSLVGRPSWCLGRPSGSLGRPSSSLGRPS